MPGRSSVTRGSGASGSKVMEISWGRFSTCLIPQAAGQKTCPTADHLHRDRISHMITTDIPVQPLSEQVERGREAQRAWSALPVSQRLRPVRRLRHLLVDQCDALCAAVKQDVDKPIDEAIAGDILPLAAACRFLERRARRVLAPRKVSLL